MFNRRVLGDGFAHPSDNGDSLQDRHLVPSLKEARQDDARVGAFHLERRFIRLDFAEHIARFHGITHGDMPVQDERCFHGVAQLGQDDSCSHVTIANVQMHSERTFSRMLARRSRFVKRLGLRALDLRDSAEFARLMGPGNHLSSACESGRQLPAMSYRLQHVSIPRPPGSDERTRAFYGDLLGLKEIPAPASLQPRRVIWYQLAADTELHIFREEALGDTSIRHFALVVDDVDAMRAKLRAAGFAPWDAETISGRPRFFCRDPNGNIIEFTTIVADYLESES